MAGEREATAYLGFTFNGKHSIDAFNLYRTSISNRYELNLGGKPSDSTEDIGGANGTYAFKDTVKNLTWDIPVAFDNVTEAQFAQMKKTFDGMGLHDLHFDEDPIDDCNTYLARVQSPPKFTFVCFDEETEKGVPDSWEEEKGHYYRRIYKGEGNIKFICYDAKPKIKEETTNTEESTT